MVELETNIRFLEPLEPQVFSAPFNIAWMSKQNLRVTEWMLLVGTSDGDWDIMSANMGERTRAAIDISDMSPLPQRLYARLRYDVYDPDHRKSDEKDGQDRWYITLVPLEINRKSHDGTPLYGQCDLETFETLPLDDVCQKNVSLRDYASLVWRTHGSSDSHCMAGRS